MVLHQPACNVGMSRQIVYEPGLGRHTKVIRTWEDDGGGGTVAFQIVDSLALSA